MEPIQFNDKNLNIDHAGEMSDRIEALSQEYNGLISAADVEARAKEIMAECIETPTRWDDGYLSCFSSEFALTLLDLSDDWNRSGRHFEEMRKALRKQAREELEVHAMQDAEFDAVFGRAA